MGTRRINRTTQIRESQILISNTKCPFKSKHFLPISLNKVRVKISVILGQGKCRGLLFITLIEIRVHLICAPALERLDT